MTAKPISRWSWLTRERLVLAGLLLFTLVLRSGVMIAMRGNLQQDPDAYREIAENLLRHGVFAMGKPSGEAFDPTKPPQPTAYRPPLYPVLLSNLPASAAKGHEVSLLKVAAVHVLLGVGTVLLTWLTARRFVGWAMPTISHVDAEADRWWAQPTLRAIAAPLIAGLLVACDPILLNQQTLVMTETLATFLTVLSLWCLARFDGQRAWFNAGLAGGAIGLAILCRPTYLPWLGLVAAAMLLVRGGNFRFQISDFRLKEAAKRKSWWRDVGWPMANATALLVVAGAVVSPWVIRNYQVFGKPIVATTHGGYTLWLGNNEYFYAWLRHDESGLPWDVASVSTATLSHEQATFLLQAVAASSEPARDEVFRRRAFGIIAADSGVFPSACLYRITQLWSPLPNKLTADESTARMMLRYATCAWYCGVYLLAAIGIWKLRWRLIAPPFIWGVLLCIAFTAVHTFYWSNLRMRAPLMPFIAIVAAAALVPNSRGPVEDRAPPE